MTNGNPEGVSPLNAPPFLPIPLGCLSAIQHARTYVHKDIIEIGSNYAGLLRPLEHHLNLETHQYIYLCTYIYIYGGDQFHCNHSGSNL